MDNMTLIKRLPPMLSGDELEKALSILPEYDPNIVNEYEATGILVSSATFSDHSFASATRSRKQNSKTFLAWRKCDSHEIRL